VHAHCIRPYSHSLSDDERLYKCAAEREAEAERDPVLLFPKFLIDEGVIDRRMLQDITHEIDEEVNRATQEAGLRVSGVVERDLPADLVAMTNTMGKILGPPWTQDEKLSAALALLVASTGDRLLRVNP
jgi:TPP-dependent pyruvate/acetoin dehydrogenase alpha subunit